MIFAEWGRQALRCFFSSVTGIGRKFLRRPVVLGVVISCELVSVIDGVRATSEPTKQELTSLVENLLQNIPFRALTQEFVVQQAIEFSDAFLSLKARRPASELPLLEAHQPMVPELRIDGFFFDNHQEPAIAVMPQRVTSGGGVTKLQWQSPTGTMLQAMFDLDRTKQELPAMISKYYESSFSLGFRQPLLKNFLGISLRRGVESAAAASRAERLALMADAESWYLGISQLFYQAWLLQRRAEFAKGFVERREKLLKVIRSRHSRGVSSRAEVYQAESAVLNAQVEASTAMATLQNAWRGLVVTIKLPEILFEYPADRIPFLLATQTDEARTRCDTLAVDEVLAANASVRAAHERATAAREHELALDWMRLPDLSVSGKVAPLNNDSGMSSAVGDTFGFQRNLWSVGFDLTVPLGPSAQRAQWLQASINKVLSQTRASSDASQARIEWLTLCHDLKRLMDDHIRLQEIHRKQKERERLEVQRFELGSIPVLSIVQAGDDFALADVSVNSSEVALRMTGLKILSASGALKPMLEQALGHY